MIINKEFEIIFVKTKKTAGTSFEIALSKFCGADDIITPINPKDEQLRSAMGFRGAQNYKNYYWSDFGLSAPVEYHNHMSINLIKHSIPFDIYNNYRKISIYRNPYDVAISRYYWEGGERTGLNFLQYLQAKPEHLLENSQISPLNGSVKCDIFLRYECLQEDMVAHGLDDIWNVFANIRAKSDKRPKVGASVFEVYRNFPDAVEIVRKSCASELEFFNYSSPF